MKSKDVFSQARGKVQGIWRAPDGRTFGPLMNFNTLTYSHSDILARLVAGQMEYKPTHIGFIYGTNATPGANLRPYNDRNQTWNDLATELADINTANVQVSPFTRPATISVDGDPVRYQGNSATFESITQTGGGLYGFPTAAPYADVLADGNYIYHAVLLSRVVVSGGTMTAIPIARVSLKNEDNTYSVKPEGFELALFWQLSYF